MAVVIHSRPSEDVFTRIHSLVHELYDLSAGDIVDRHLDFASSIHPEHDFGGASAEGMGKPTESKALPGIRGSTGSIRGIRQCAVIDHPVAVGVVLCRILDDVGGIENPVAVEYFQ